MRSTKKRVDAAMRVEARDAREPAVDDQPHAIDREGRFGDIRRHDHFRLTIARHGRVLARSGASSP